MNLKVLFVKTISFVILFSFCIHLFELILFHADAAASETRASVSAAQTRNHGHANAASETYTVTAPASVRVVSQTAARLHAGNDRLLLSEPDHETCQLSHRFMKPDASKWLEPLFFNTDNHLLLRELQYFPFSHFALHVSDCPSIFHPPC